MAAKYWGVINDFNEYHRLRPKYGDSTDASAQVRTLQALGLQAKFVQVGSVDKLKEQNTGGNNPGVEGALDVDPDVIGGYTCATAEAAGVKFELTTLAKMGRFDQEVSIDMPAASDIPRLETITVKPVCMGFEDFYAGWSPETPPGFSVSPIQGRMERRGGEPSLFDIEVKADGQTGEKVGYLCIVLPDDDEQFTIKVTVNCF